MLIVATAVHAITFTLSSSSTVLGSLAIRALVALAIGAIIPFAFIVRWALMDGSERKKGFEKSGSFRKKFDEHWG